MDKAISCRTAVLAAVFLCIAPRAYAQAGEKDVGEVSAYGGLSLGADAHGMAGGSAGIAVSRYGLMLFDVSYMPLGHHTIQGWPAPSTVVHSRLWDFGLDAHIRVPVKDRWEPYVILGTGLLWDVVRQKTQNAAGASVIYNVDQFNGVFHTGAGLRYYVGQNWGIRPEVKVVVSQHTYTCLTIGFFYVTPPEWP